MSLRAGSAWAQAPVLEEANHYGEDPEAVQAYIDSIEASYVYHTGDVVIADGIATLRIPDGFKFLDGEQGRQVATELWGNPPAIMEGVLGIVLPAGSGVVDQPFAFLIKYSDIGHVSDSDADRTNYDDLLERMKRDNVAVNDERRKTGQGMLTLLGWASPPYYDSDRKVLHWAMEFYLEGQDLNVLNYDVRILGRRGALVLSAVAGMDRAEEVRAVIPRMLDMATFNAGYAYTDFDPAVDQASSWTIGGLVSGSIIAKAGVVISWVRWIQLGVFAGAGIGFGVGWLVWGRRSPKRKEPVA